MAEKSNTKLIVGMAVALIATAAVSVVATLSVTSNTSNSTDIVSMKGDTLTVAEFYDKIKKDSTAQQSAVQMVVSDILNKKYGNKVTDKDVQKLYDEQTATLGTDVEAALSSYGYTVESFKESLRDSLVQQYVIDQAAAKDIKTEDYQAAYDNYTPEVTAQIIKLDDEAKAKEVLEKAKAGEDFAQLAKDNSTDEASKKDGGKVTFDSTTTDYPVQLTEAIFKLEAGKVGEEVVTVVDGATYATSFYVVKLEKKAEKSKNWEDYKDTLKKWIIAQRKADTNFGQAVIAKELTAANVKVKDEAFQAIFTQYMSTTTASSGTSGSSSEAPASSETSSSKE